MKIDETKWKIIYKTENFILVETRGRFNLPKNEELFSLLEEMRRNGLKCHLNDYYFNGKILFERFEQTRSKTKSERQEEDLKKKVEELKSLIDIHYPKEYNEKGEDTSDWIEMWSFAINKEIKEYIDTIFGNEGDNHSEEKRLLINRAKVPHAKDVSEKKGCKKDIPMFYSEINYIVKCGEVNPISKEIVYCDECEKESKGK